MDVTVVEENEGVLEFEVNDSVLPNVLASKMAKNNVDAFFYRPHPLLPGYRVHIESSNPRKDLSKAVGDVESDLKELTALFNKSLK